jgi:hypothetical protein
MGDKIMKVKVLLSFDLSNNLLFNIKQYSFIKKRSVSMFMFMLLKNVNTAKMLESLYVGDYNA